MANILNTSISGTSGQILTFNGSNGTTYSASPAWGSASTVLSIPSGENKVVVNESATLDVKGKVHINGIDLEERLEIIERVLGIPERDIAMEAKYPSLKKKFDDYINSLEKYRTFERIKGEDV